MSRPAASLGLALGLLLGLLTNACTEDSGGTTAGACEMVIDACHEKDDGSDEAINDCHAKAHNYDDAACSTDLQACLDVCNAAPPIESAGDDHDHATHGSEGSDGSSGHDHATSTSGADGSTTHDHGSTSEGTTGGSTGADDSSQASCKELGSICHDAADDFGAMCHDVGHDGDEAACAAIWVECLEHCA